MSIDEAPQDDPGLSAPADDSASFAASALETQASAPADHSAPLESHDQGGLDTGSPAPVTQPSFLERLSQAGIPLQSQDEAGALAELAAVYQAIPQLRQFAQIGQQVYPQLNEFQAWQLQQQQAARAAQQPAPQAPIAKAASRPDFDERWVGMCTQTRDGRWVVRPELAGSVPFDIPGKVQAYFDWQQDRANSVLTDWRSPQEILDDAKRQTQEMIQQHLQGFQQHQQTATQVNSVLAQNPWLYQADATGAPVINPATGQPLLSHEGQQYAGTLNSLINGNWADPGFQHQVAMLVMHGQRALSGQVAQSQNGGQQINPAQQQLAGQQQQLLSRFRPGAGRMPNRNGGRISADAAGEPQNSDLSFGDMLRQSARSNGLLPAQG